MGVAVACRANGLRSPGAGVTGYVPFAVSCRNRSDSPTEATVQVKYRTAGLASNFVTFVTANAATSTTTVTLRKNGANTALGVSIGAGATGLFEDLADTVQIAVNDLMAIRFVIGATGATSFSYVGATYTPASSQTVWMGAADTPLNLGTPSTTNYTPILGVPSSTTTEAWVQTTIRDPYTVNNFAFYVGTNTRADATTVRTRKNGANGNLSVTVGASATGLFEDTANSDSLVAGDLYNVAYVIGAGAGNLGGSTVCTHQAQFTATGGRTHLWLNADPATATLNPILAGATQYQGPGGTFDGFTTTEANAQHKYYEPYSLRNLEVYINANTLTASSTVTLRKNGADGNLTVTVGSGATGRFTDNVNSDTINPGALVDWKVVAGGTGTSMQLALIAATAVNLSDELLPPNNIYLSKTTGPAVKRFLFHAPTPSWSEATGTLAAAIQRFLATMGVGK